MSALFTSGLSSQTGGAGRRSYLRADIEGRPLSSLAQLLRETNR
ncbi:hypothetical protein AK812_SmicGene45748, partial [Symbiodinium microadriaticum]